MSDLLNSLQCKNHVFPQAITVVARTNVQYYATQHCRDRAVIGILEMVDISLKFEHDQAELTFPIFTDSVNRNYWLPAVPDFQGGRADFAPLDSVEVGRGQN